MAPTAHGLGLHLSYCCLLRDLLLHHTVLHAHSDESEQAKAGEAGEDSEHGHDDGEQHEEEEHEHEEEEEAGKREIRSTGMGQAVGGPCVTTLR